MIKLTEIKTSNKSSGEIESDLLIMGMFKEKKLNPTVRKIDTQIACKLSNAMALDKFTGKKNTRLSLYGNEINKRMLLVGLGGQKKYNTDRARSIAAEVRQSGINVNCIAPGATLTGRFRATLQNRSKEDKEKIMSKGKSILTRPAEPGYISSVVDFLLSDESKYISGQVIRIDGGQFTSPI